MQQCCFGAFQCRRRPPSPLLVYHHRHRPNSSSPIKPGLPLPWLFDGKSRREREKERGGRSVGGRSSATVAITAATGVGWGRGSGGFASVRPSVGPPTGNGHEMSATLCEAGPRRCTTFWVGGRTRTLGPPWYLGGGEGLHVEIWWWWRNRRGRSRRWKKKKRRTRRAAREIEQKSFLLSCESMFLPCARSLFRRCKIMFKNTSSSLKSSLWQTHGGTRAVECAFLVSEF